MNSVLIAGYKDQYETHLERLMLFLAPVEWDMSSLTVTTKSGCAIFRRVDGVKFELNLLSFLGVIRVLYEDSIKTMEGANENGTERSDGIRTSEHGRLESLCRHIVTPGSDGRGHIGGRME